MTKLRTATDDAGNIKYCLVGRLFDDGWRTSDPLNNMDGTLIELLQGAAIGTTADLDGIADTIFIDTVDDGAAWDQA